MTKIKAIFGVLVAGAAGVGVFASGAAQASASSAPIVIPYVKTCDTPVHCAGTAGVDGELEMWITSFRGTGAAAQLALTEKVTVGGISFTAELNGHVAPDFRFIVLNGRVTDGSFAGAEVHQRSDLTGIDGSGTAWSGQLWLMPATV